MLIVRFQLCVLGEFVRYCWWVKELLKIRKLFNRGKNDVLSFEVTVLLHLSDKVLLVHDGVGVEVLVVLVVIGSVVFAVPDFE